MTVDRYFAFNIFFLTIFFNSKYTSINSLSNFEIFFWILFVIFTIRLTWINFRVSLDRRVPISLRVSKKTKFIIAWWKFLNELQNIVWCLIILLVHIFPKWNFVQILRLYLICKICKASTLLIINSSSFVGFKLRLLDNICILFQWRLWLLLNLFKCIYICSKSVCLLCCHLTIVSFQRVLGSICRNSLSVLNILLAFSCVISQWEKINTACIFFTNLLIRFIESLISIYVINIIGQHLLINCLVESLNVWVNSTVYLIISSIHCLLYSVSLHNLHIVEEIDFGSIFRSEFGAHTCILVGF